MKKNELVKLAVVGIAACFCMSGQVARKANPELAMTKCTKSSEEPEKMDMSKPEADQQMDDQTSQNMTNKNKGAAKRVVEGGRNTSESGVNRKSAARRAIEAEIAREGN